MISFPLLDTSWDGQLSPESPPEQGQLGAATAPLILRREKREGRCRDRPMDVRVDKFSG